MPRSRTKKPAETIKNPEKIIHNHTGVCRGGRGSAGPDIQPRMAVGPSKPCLGS